MDYRDLVSSLECEALEHRHERAGELLAQAAAAIMELHNRATELEMDIEDLQEKIASIEAARLRLVK